MDPKIDIGSVQEDKGLGWGKFLPIPSVQEMEKNDSQSEPERYIQEHKNRPHDSEISQDMSNIPIIKFSLLTDGDEYEPRKLDIACKERGFFQLIDHGVTEKILHDMKAAMAAFFELPLEEKKKCAVGERDIQDYGQSFVTSEQHKLGWSYLLYLWTGPSKSRQFKHWSVSIPGFTDAVENYCKELQKVTERIISQLIIVDGNGETRFTSCAWRDKTSHGHALLSTCSSPELVLDVRPHRDSGTMTFLTQDDDITALQIRHEQKWVPVKPIPNAIVVNIGDSVEVWSNGVYKCIEHRAVTNAKRARMSIATFVIQEMKWKLVHWNQWRMIKFTPECLERSSFIDYIKQCMKKKQEGTADMELLKLEAE